MATWLPASIKPLPVPPADGQPAIAAIGLRLWSDGAPNLWGGWHGVSCPCLACADARALTQRSTQRGDRLA